MSLNSKYARRLRERLIDAQAGRCCYCGRSFTTSGVTRPTLEHKLPRRDGGPDAVRNLAVACFHCNQHRGKQIDQSRKSADGSEVETIFEPICDHCSNPFTDGVVTPDFAICAICNGD
jgi:5-methylcytosine-specific restriction endonuclease McrA